jgi:hypothetical protein
VYFFIDRFFSLQISDPYVTDGSLTEKMHILTGDFNCVLDKEIDRYPSRNYDDTGGKELKTIMTKINII